MSEKIKISVQWLDSQITAGQDLRCQINFENRIEHHDSPVSAVNELRTSNDEATPTGRRRSRLGAGIKEQHILRSKLPATSSRVSSHNGSRSYGEAPAYIESEMQLDDETAQDHDASATLIPVHRQHEALHREPSYRDAPESYSSSHRLDFGTVKVSRGQNHGKYPFGLEEQACDSGKTSIDSFRTNDSIMTHLNHSQDPWIESATHRSDPTLDPARDHPDKFYQSDDLRHSPKHSFSRPRIRQRRNSVEWCQTLNSPRVSLLMGFAQIEASCQLNKAFVNADLFRGISRGINAIKSPQAPSVNSRGNEMHRQSGVFSSFSLTSIGDTVGSFLGGDLIGRSQHSHSPGGKDGDQINIISTPRTVLFVNMVLEPGEIRSFIFSHPLPHNIPPSFRGSLFKTTYNLVIGIQIPQGGMEQDQERFRCFRYSFDVRRHPWTGASPAVYDLARPYIYRQDLSTVIDASQTSKQNGCMITHVHQKAYLSSNNALCSYLKTIRGRSNGDPRARNMSQAHDRKTNAQHRAIVQPNVSLSQQAPNDNTGDQAASRFTRFELQCQQGIIATIELLHWHYRKGQVVPVAIKFAESSLPCYAIHASLLSTEIVSTVAALRSIGSNQRMTQRIHDRRYFYTNAVEKISFDFAIPGNVSSSFSTTAVSLEWKLLFEFVVAKPASEGERLSRRGTYMIKNIKDSRATSRIALSSIQAAKFEVVVLLDIDDAVNDC